MSPIKAENRSLYPKDWRETSRRIRFERAQGVCECDGRCGRAHFGGERCTAVHGESHPETASKVILTVAHLDHDPTHSTDDNLLAMCQRCHLNYDAEHHAETRAASKIPNQNESLFAASEEEKP